MTKKSSLKDLILSVAVTISISLADSGFRKCDNSNSTVFNCSGVGLTVAHIPVLERYQIVDFSNNNLTAISKHTFPTDNAITALYLINNKIKTIHTRAFGELRDLIQLDLSENLLEGNRLHGRPFYNLDNLETLNMNRNPLRLIRQDMFCFLDLNSLKQLHLSYCRISQVRVDAFNLPFLEHLDLSWNHIKHFYKSQFKRLRRLKTLNLCHNKIKLLNQVPVLPELRIFNLDNNKIHTVSIKKEMKYGTDRLEMLYLRNNDIETFTNHSFSWDLDHLEGIYLEHNPIQCDCQMNWIAGNKDIKSKNSTIMCTAPLEHKGKNLLTIPADELKCTLSSVTVSLIIAMTIVVVLSLIAGCILAVNEKLRWKHLSKLSRSWAGANYTAVYTAEGEDIRVYSQDYEKLVEEEGREFYL